MKKIGFVIPWYSEKIPGGAEMELRGLTTHLHESGIEVEILTTCVKEFSADWNDNYFKEGEDTVHGFKIRRFKVRKRDTAAFDAVNFKLINNQKITAEEEKIYIDEMVNSPDLCSYIAEHKDEYSVFVFIPYMFGTTVNGLKVCPEKSVLIPCFHDESYVYMDIFKEVFRNIAGIIYHANPEYDLANRIFDFSSVNQAVLGEGVYTDLVSDGEDFRRKFGINSPFILYAGRKDSGKNVDTLVKYYAEYLKRRDTELKLILIGGGKIELPRELTDSGRIVDLGFVDIQDKYNAQAAAELLCQPSKHESFSLVIMESWLCGRPVLVSEDCNVTKNFVSESNGGLYFKDYFDFEGCVDYILKNKEIAAAMGENGRQYVKSNFAWDVIVEKYMNFFEGIVENAEKNCAG
ncbi:MAG: glycosyltransferase family 4 protein [Oscillospiraceae bacterium]|nr:glycosyltransferase family 4 protein [Oscillospiraceae bacterium]